MRNKIFFALLYYIVAVSCTPKKKNTEIRYYQDFDRINVAGVHELTREKLEFPYVEIKRYEDSSLQVNFYRAKSRTFSKKYFYKNGILSSTMRYRDSDRECNGLSEVQYYFQKNKMITYTFCGRADMTNKQKVHHISAEEVSPDPPYWHHVIAGFIATSDTVTISKLPISFQPQIDFVNFFEAEFLLIYDMKSYRKNDTVHEVHKDYYTLKGGLRDYFIDSTLTGITTLKANTIWNHPDLDYVGF